MAYDCGVGSPRAIAVVSLTSLLALASCSDDPVRTSSPAPPGDSYRISLGLLIAPPEYVTGTAADDVYSGSDGLLLHYDGSTWTPMPMPDEVSRVYDIWPVLGGRVVIDGGNWFHLFNGEIWDHIASPGSRACVLPTGEIFAVEYSGIAWFYDGDVWSADSIPGVNDVRDLHAAAANDACAISYGGEISHFDGTSWTTVRVDSLELTSVWRTSDQRTFVTAYYGRLFEFAGGTFNPVLLPNGFQSDRVFGSGGQVYVFGSNNDGYALQRYDGSQWTAMRLGSTEYAADFWAAPTGDVLVASYDGLWRAGDTASERILGGIEYSEEVRALWTSPEDGVFAVGRGAYRVDGGEWIDLGKKNLTLETAHAVHGTRGDNVYAVGDHMILHYDGRAWDWVSSGFGARLRDVWVSPREVFAVGLEGAIVRMRGGVWEKVASPTAVSLASLSGWDDGAVAVGADGTILRYDGEAWRAEPGPVTWSLYDVQAFGPERMVAVGDDPWWLLVRDRDGWSAQRLESNRRGWAYNVAVCGSSPSDVFVLQRTGDVHHFDGRTWSALPRCVLDSAMDLAATPDGDLLLAAYDAVIRYQRSR
jgi:hypothetical protein